MAADSSGIPPETTLYIGGAPRSRAMSTECKSAPSRAIPPVMNFAIHERSFPQGRSDSAANADTKSRLGGITGEFRQR